MPKKNAKPKATLIQESAETADQFSTPAKKSAETEARKLIFFIPFPKSDNDVFDGLVASHKTKKGPGKIYFAKETHPRGSLKMKYHPEKGKGFKEYSDDLAGIEKNLATHQKGALESYEREQEPVEIEVVHLPTSVDELEEIREKFSNLKRNELLFIDAHGNPDLIGIGPFTMNEVDIGDNLAFLGLPKEHPPHICLWACNSGAQDKDAKVDQTLANAVKRHLERKGFEHVSVTGTKSLLYSNENARLYKSYVGKKDTDVYGRETVHHLKDEKALHTVATPVTTSVLPFAKGGLYTQTRGYADAKEIAHKTRSRTTATTTTTTTTKTTHLGLFKSPEKKSEKKQKRKEVEPQTALDSEPNTVVRSKKQKNNTAVPFQIETRSMKR